MPLLTRPHRLCLLLFSLGSQDRFVLHSFALHLHSHHHLFLLSHGSLDVLFLPVQEVGGNVGSVHPKDSILQLCVGVSTHLLSVGLPMTKVLVESPSKHGPDCVGSIFEASSLDCL